MLRNDLHVSFQSISFYLSYIGASVAFYGVLGIIFTVTVGHFTDDAFYDPTFLMDMISHFLNRLFSSHGQVDTYFKTLNILFCNYHQMKLEVQINWCGSQ
jgi:hypothetical protein